MQRPYFDPFEQMAVLRTLGFAGGGAGLRASDDERERAADALRRHHGEGRISTEELSERTERAYAATTRGDLDRLFVDLPRLRPVERDRPSLGPRLWLRIAAVPLFVWAFIAIALLSSHALWFVWLVMLFVFFRAARRRHGWRAARSPEPWRRY